MNYKQHPLSSAYPSMTDVEFAALVEDIRAHGQRDPVTLFDGMVLDGWHRYQACNEVGVACRTIAFDGSDPAAFVISKNSHRRQLTESQRAATIVAVHEWRESGGVTRVTPAKTAGGDTCRPSATVRQMAEEAGVDERTIQRAKQAHAAGLGDAVRDGLVSANKAAAIAKADPELAKQVAHGVVSLPAAVEQVTGKRPGAKPQEQGKPDDIVSRLRARIAELEQENADLREQHEEAMSNMGVMADELTAYRRAADPEHAKKYLQHQEYLTVVERQRDDWMNQCAQLKREVKALRRRIGEAA